MKRLIMTLLGGLVGYKIADWYADKFDNEFPSKPVGLFFGGYLGYEAANMVTLGDLVGRPPLVIVPTR